jgi:hypothetical protein
VTLFMEVMAELLGLGVQLWCFVSLKRMSSY